MELIDGSTDEAVAPVGHGGHNNPHNDRDAYIIYLY